jgi:hypothetical protein
VDIEELGDVHGLEEGTIIQGLLSFHNAWHVYQSCKEKFLIDKHTLKFESKKGPYPYSLRSGRIRNISRFLSAFSSGLAWFIISLS